MLKVLNEPLLSSYVCLYSRLDYTVILVINTLSSEKFSFKKQAHLMLKG